MSTRNAQQRDTRAKESPTPATAGTHEATTSKNSSSPIERARFFVDVDYAEKRPGALGAQHAANPKRPEGLSAQTPVKNRSETWQSAMQRV